MNKIKDLREEKGVSQEDVAKKIGISRQAVSLYEKGEREPNLETWEKLADYFGVPVGKIMGNLPKVSVLHFETDAEIEYFDPTLPDVGGIQYWFVVDVEREGVNINPDEVLELNDDDVVYYQKYDADPRTGQPEQSTGGTISVSDIKNLETAEMLLKYEPYELANFSKVWIEINKELAKRKNTAVDLWELANSDERNEYVKVAGQTITQKDWMILYKWMEKYVNKSEEK